MATLFSMSMTVNSSRLTGHCNNSLFVHLSLVQQLFQNCASRKTMIRRMLKLWQCLLTMLCVVLTLKRSTDFALTPMAPVERLLLTDTHQLITVGIWNSYSKICPKDDCLTGEVTRILSTVISFCLIPLLTMVNLTIPTMVE